MSSRKKVSTTTSIGSVGIAEHSLSSQWKAMTGGVTMAVYAKNTAVLQSQLNPKGDSGWMSRDAGYASVSAPTPKVFFIHEFADALRCSTNAWKCRKIRISRCTANHNQRIRRDPLHAELSLTPAFIASPARTPFLGGLCCPPLLTRH